MSSADALHRLLKECSVAPGPAEKLSGFLALLQKWNARINLISTTDWRITGQLFREGIWASSLYSQDAVSHLDIGSGAGFPALLLKILIPRIELDMIERREKKAQFLETAAHSLDLCKVHVHAMTLEQYLTKCCGKTWDCISWKGLKLRSADLLQLHAHMDPNARLWMFHGKALAVEQPGQFHQHFELMKTESVPATRDSRLSIYRAA